MGDEGKIKELGPAMARVRARKIARTYTYTLKPDTYDDGSLVYMGVCHELPCVFPEVGATLLEATVHIEDAVVAVLAAMIEHGEPIPEPENPRV